MLKHGEQRYVPGALLMISDEWWLTVSDCSLWGLVGIVARTYRIVG